MSESTVIVPANIGGMEVLKGQYNLLVQATRELLRRDLDFGVIPGTDKPTLLKPGAEKLAVLFGLRPAFELRDKMEEWDQGRFAYRYACVLYRDGIMAASAEGGANSLEKKYRWRYVPEFKATEEEKARARRRETRISKNGNQYIMLVMENDDPYTLVNTLMKMAQKRALVAAVLVATGASEFFTQDVEDMVIEGEFEEVQNEPQRQSRKPPVPQKQSAQKPSAQRNATENGNGKDKRSWPPQVVQAVIAAGAENSYAACGALNHSTLAVTDELDVCVEWYKKYRAARDGGKAVEAAATEADAWLNSVMHTAEQGQGELPL